MRRQIGNYRYVEIKEHVTEQLLGNRRNERRNQEKLKKKHLGRNKNKYNKPKSIYSKNYSKREVHSKTDLPQNTKKSQTI